jgi:hypothetical protein
MPNFGQHTESVLKGILNLVIVLTNKYQSPALPWFIQLMEPCTEALRESLSSTYLANQLVEARISNFVHLVRHLNDYGTESLLNAVKDQIFLP